MALTKIPANLLDKSAHVDFGDNEQLRIGTGNDLVLKHTGSNTIIHNTTGELRLRADTLRIQDYTNEHAMISADRDGSVYLYYDNSQKFQTNSSGATVTGDLTVSGDLNITGDVNSASVTDLDVVDKTITLGKGQVESASGGSGIVIDGSGASFTWDETNDRFQINKALNADLKFTLDASGTTDVAVELGGGTSDNHYSYIDLVSDATYTDYGLRIIRNNGGANTTSGIHHRGTGNLFIRTDDSAPITFLTNMNGGGSEIMRIASNGSVGIGMTSPSTTYKLDVSGSVRSSGNSPSFNLREDDSSNQHWALGSYGGVFALRNVTGGTYPLQSSGGQVGIGMAPDASKNYALDIQATTGGNALRLRGRNAGGNEGWLAWTDYAGNIEAAMYATADNLIFANTTSYTERMRIASDGNVKIGSGAPAFNTGGGLEIERAGTVALRLQDTTNKSVELLMGSDFEIHHMNSSSNLILNPGGAVIFENGSNEVGRFNSDGWLNINGNVASDNPPDSQGLFIGWNHTNGHGEVNYVANKGAGTYGGHRFYDNSANGSLVEKFRIGAGAATSSDEDVIQAADSVGIRSTHYANFEGQSWNSTDNNVNVRKALHEAVYGSYNVNFAPGPYSNGIYYVLAGKKASTANSYIKFKIALNKATHLKLTQTVANSADSTSRVTSIHYSFDDKTYVQAASAAFGAGVETTTATLNFNSIGTQSIGGVFTGNIYVRMRLYLGSSSHESLIGWRTVKIESKAEDMQLINSGGPQYGPVEAAMFRLDNASTIVSNNGGFCDLRAHSSGGYFNPEIFEIDTTGNYGIHIKRDGKVWVNMNQDIVSTGSTSYATSRIYRSPSNDANNRVMSYQLVTNTDGQWGSIHNTACFDVNAGDRIQFYLLAGGITNLDTTSWSQYNIMWMDSQHSGSNNRAAATYQENAHYDFIG